MIDAVPEWFDISPRPVQRDRPELAMIASMVLQALQDAREYAERRAEGSPVPGYCVEADAWLRGHEDGPMGFRWCLRKLGMDAERVQHLVLRGEFDVGAVKGAARYAKPVRAIRGGPGQRPGPEGAAAAG